MRCVPYPQEGCLRAAGHSGSSPLAALRLLPGESFHCKADPGSLSSSTDFKRLNFGVCEQGTRSGGAVQTGRVSARTEGLCNHHLPLSQLEESEARCAEAQRCQQATALQLENLHAELETLSRNKTLVRGAGQRRGPTPNGMHGSSNPKSPGLLGEQPPGPLMGG